MRLRSKTMRGRRTRRAGRYSSHAPSSRPSILASARASPITGFACICPAIAGLRRCFARPQRCGGAQTRGSRAWTRLAWRGARSFICAWRCVTAIPTGRDGRSAGQEIAAEARARLAALDAPHEALDATRRRVVGALAARAPGHAQRYAQADGRRLPASRAACVTRGLFRRLLRFRRLLSFRRLPLPSSEPILRPWEPGSQARLAGTG